MEKPHAFKFLEEDCNRQLMRLLELARIEFHVGPDGTICYSPDDEEFVENHIICSIRDAVFPAWQVLTSPPDWTPSYKMYMNDHGIPFREEWSNGEWWFLLPRKHRPHLWKLAETKAGPVAIGLNGE